MIDHMFTNLDSDKNGNTPTFSILIEVSLHLVVISVTWFAFHNFVKRVLENIFSTKVREHTEQSISIVAAIVLVGLQKNLIDKINYITTIHPVRDY
jgi:hypothetical protein